MTSIKVKLHLSAASGREGSVYYLITHERKVRQLPTGYRILPEEWSDSRSNVIVDRSSERCGYLLRVRERIRHDVARLTRLSRRLGERGPEYTADDVVDEFNRYMHDYTLFNFMDSIIEKLKHNGKIRTSETYRATANSFRKFLTSREQYTSEYDESDLMIDCLTSETMEAYEAWQKGRGLTPNTTSFYARILRAVYNRAVEVGAVENRMPFRHVYTGVEKTVKRALPLPAIRKIKELDLMKAPSLEFARDIFLLSFFLRGMSFIDMSYLKKTDLRNGYITYRRRKTGQLLIIKWTKEMQQIVDKYPDNPGDFLLPIITAHGSNERSAYLNASYRINNNLKKLARMAGITVPLTLYVARHSWASAARAKGVPLSVISKGMGHDSETTTQIYLASLETSVVDKANSLILKCLG